MGKKILVTGGAGAIGSYLVNQLSKDAGDHITVLDNLSSGRIENIEMRPNIKFIQGGVESDESLDLVFREKFDLIFHFAANFANQNSVEFPQKDLLVNGMGTLKLLHRAVQSKVKRVVYSSSSCVYGNRNEPLSEQCREFSLDTPYAITKLLGEQYVNFFAEHHKIEAVILRFFNVYGPNEYPGKYRNAIANFFYKAMRNEDIVITGTGDETRDFNFCDDTVRAVILASRSSKAVGKVLNIASGRETKIKDITRKILKMTGSKSKLVYQPRRNWDSVLRRVASIGLAKEILDYEPRISIDEGLSRYYAWLKVQSLNKCEW
jgi:nucleoside-diphosphate-sugar epimerase